MTEIPEDVMKVAYDVFIDAAVNGLTQEAIARAIMAERERCAEQCIRFADEAAAPTKGDFVRADAYLTAAAAIRKGASHDAD